MWRLAVPELVMIKLGPLAFRDFAKDAFFFTCAWKPAPASCTLEMYRISPTGSSTFRCPRSLGAFSAPTEMQMGRIASTSVRSCAYTCGYSAGGPLMRCSLDSSSSSYSRQKVGVKRTDSMASCRLASSIIHRPDELCSVCVPPLSPAPLAWNKSIIACCPSGVESASLPKICAKLPAPGSCFPSTTAVRAVAMLPHLRAVCSVVSIPSNTKFACKRSFSARQCATNPRSNVDVGISRTRVW
mmetsp:Transcript_12350/g.29817  ORF Transcript_12350/g.29817 Transcript_12350/m.29817 type:complete len:242 (-) Transcript_12350:496-1221(-)